MIFLKALGQKEWNEMHSDTTSTCCVSRRESSDKRRLGALWSSASSRYDLNEEYQTQFGASSRTKVQLD